jgi:hypothetical protein
MCVDLRVKSSLLVSKWNKNWNEAAPNLSEPPSSCTLKYMSSWTAEFIHEFKQIWHSLSLKFVSERTKD